MVRRISTALGNIGTSSHRRCTPHHRRRCCCCCCCCNVWAGVGMGGRRPTTGPRSNIFTWRGIKIFCPDPRNLYRGNIGRGGQLRVRVCFPPVSHGVTSGPGARRPGAPHLHHPLIIPSLCQLGSPMWRQIAGRCGDRMLTGIFGGIMPSNINREISNQASVFFGSGVDLINLYESLSVIRD